MAPRRAALVVHGHRDGHAVGDRAWISTECRARVRAAEAVAEQRPIDAVLFSGAGKAGFPSEARQMAECWIRSDVRVSLDEQSTDSAENATAAVAWALEIGADELVVVSSWWHVRLFLYYRWRRLSGMPIRYAWTTRWRGTPSHLLHEFRYLPRALRSLRRQPELSAATGAG